MALLAAAEDHPQAGMNYTIQYGGEDEEVIRFVAPENDPQQGCHGCPGCIEFAEKGRLKHHKHTTCWKAGRRGQSIAVEQRRREALVAAEQQATSPMQQATSPSPAAKQGVKLAPNDDPFDGCEGCEGCEEVLKKGELKKKKHSCWKRGYRGQGLIKERKIREGKLAAALAALAALNAGGRLCPAWLAPVGGGAPSRVWFGPLFPTPT